MTKTFETDFSDLAQWNEISFACDLTLALKENDDRLHKQLHLIGELLGAQSEIVEMNPERIAYKNRLRCANDIQRQTYSWVMSSGSKREMPESDGCIRVTIGLIKSLRSIFDSLKYHRGNIAVTSLFPRKDVFGNPKAKMVRDTLVALGCSPKISLGGFRGKVVSSAFTALSQVYDGWVLAGKDLAKYRAIESGSEQGDFYQSTLSLDRTASLKQLQAMVYQEKRLG